MAGQRMDPTKVLLDPYAKAIINGRLQFGEMGPDLPYKEADVLGLAATWPQAACALPAGVVGGKSTANDSDDNVFDWQGDRPLNIPMEDLVIYEAHVRGFTADPSSGVNAPGTYAGLTERLDYLKSLGINALELMPVQEFNELEYYDVTSQYPRYNYWGYSTVGFFAPMARYSAAGNAGKGGPSIINEFKTLVREAHKRGIEVILDVVFNHTAEGNENGPCLSFRGLDNRVYYMLAPEGQYYNYSGCGNTMNCNHPNVRQFILDCLRYWVEEMHVDGFRFDLGSILTRAHSNWHPATTTLDTDDEWTDVEDERNNNINGELIIGGEGEGGYLNYPPSSGAYVNEHGHMTDGSGVPTGTPLPDPPLVAAISEDPLLANVKLIAEAWDCDGLNQVGAFPHYGGRWSEWNGHFRDTVRQFIKGTDGPWVGNFAAVLCASPHIYLHDASEEDWWGYNGGKRWKGGRGPTATINFVTAHDGFTLQDLVSYNEKHNEGNGEENRDGESHNLSWNCGEEGATEEPGVMALRSRQMRNMLCALFLAHGVPMLLMGDEVCHSKGGNNNTYCHDSELNWLNWDAVRQDDEGLLRFVKGMIAFRMSKKELRRSDHVREGEIEWHGVVPSEPDWTETSRLVAFTMKTGTKGGGIYVAFNSSHQSLVLELPVLGWEGRTWQPFVDTGKSAPFDCLTVDEVLTEEDVEAAKASMGMWTLQNQYPMLPWSCVILESVVVGKRAVMPVALRGGVGGGGKKKEKKAKKYSDTWN
jgi:isoamylase